MTPTVHLISHTQVTCSTVTLRPHGGPLSIPRLWAGSPNQGLHPISNWTVHTLCEETRVKDSPLSHTCNMFYFVCQRVYTHVYVHACACTCVLCVWTSEGILSFHHVSSGVGTRIGSLGLQANSFTH